MKKKRKQPQKQLDVKNPSPLAQPLPEGNNHLRWLRISLALAVIALLYFYRIDRPPVWGDEAETGIEARNVRIYGYPIAFDGRNVNIYDNGAQLNQNLVYKKIPWLQFYLGAASMAIFGDNTAGLRILFVLAGLAAFFPIYAVLKPRIKYAEIVAAFVLISPQIVLFQRNARYFSILILLYSLLVWHLYYNFKSAKNRFIVAAIVLILFFHTHTLAAVCACMSLILYCMLFRREAIWIYSGAAGIALMTWLFWNAPLGPPLMETPFAIRMITTNFGMWLTMFFQGLVAVVVDLDVVGCLPILLWIGMFVLLFLRDRRTVSNILKEPLFSFVFLTILIQAVATAALFGYETPERHSLLRYMPHLAAFALVSCFFVLDAVVPWKSLFFVICALALGFNFLTFSLYLKPFSRNVPVSWVLPVYTEIFQPRKGVWDDIVAKLRDESAGSHDNDTVIITNPPWTQGMTIFYLGDRYLVSPRLNPGSGDCEQAIRRIMGDESFFKLVKKPKWILEIRGDLEPAPKDGYASAAVYPSHTANPDEGARPELTRRKFFQPEPVGKVELFRLRE